MKIIKKPVAQLKAAPYNPRRDLKPSDPEYQRIKRSIETFGLVEPLIFNERSGYLVGGHQRAKVLAAIGVKDVEVVVVDLDDKKERTLNAALNKVGGAWDYEKLREALAGLELDELALTGFDDGEIAKYLDIKGKPGKTRPDDTPALEKKIVAKMGELWKLGEHRLLCGNSTIGASYDRLLKGEQVALVATDPPYMVDYNGERPGGKGGKWADTKWDSSAKPQEFFDAWINAAIAHAKPNAAWYVWHASVNEHLPKSAMQRAGILVHQQIIWVKPSPVFGYSFFPWAHEPAWLGWKHEPACFGWKKGNKPPRDADRSMGVSTVWTIDYDGKARLVDGEHPTQKPVEIFAMPMRKHTQRGDVCLEPFSGSGSQIIAAERLGRRCYAIEREPAFVDVAVRRWEQFTGRKAERIK